MEDTTLTIRIDKELDQHLEESSKKSGRSKSELVRQALKRQLSIESFQELRNNFDPIEKRRDGSPTKMFFVKFREN